ncbi:MAG: hypothetical protein ACYTDT_05835 [Planctomycetota bacterium]
MLPSGNIPYRPAEPVASLRPSDTFHGADKLAYIGVAMTVMTASPFGLLLTALAYKRARQMTRPTGNDRLGYYVTWGLIITNVVLSIVSVLFWMVVLNQSGGSV